MSADSDAVSRREYEQRWADHLRVHEQEENARARAVDTINERLQGMNEFRQTINDTNTHMLTKVEFNAWREGMQAQQRWMVTTVIALGALALAGFVALVATR